MCESAQIPHRRTLSIVLSLGQRLLITACVKKSVEKNSELSVLRRKDLHFHDVVPGSLTKSVHDREPEPFKGQTFCDDHVHFFRIKLS